MSVIGKINQHRPRGYYLTYTFVHIQVFWIIDPRIEESSDKIDLQWLEREEEKPMQSKLMAKW